MKKIIDDSDSEVDKDSNSYKIGYAFGEAFYMFLFFVGTVVGLIIMSKIVFFIAKLIGSVLNFIL